MSITDELREWARLFKDVWIHRSDESITFTTCESGPMDIDAVRLEDGFTSIADRIDAEHERMLEALTTGMLPMDDEHMEAEGWVRLPVDADGVPIHFGDLLHEHEDGYVFKVDGFKIWGWSKEWWAYQEEGIQAPVHKCTHYHAPTVEDVLIELLETAVGYSDAHTTVALDAVAEYAAKLQLKEDA